MLEHLNKRTRDAVLRLAAGKDISFGGERQAPLSEEGARPFLCITAKHLDELRDKKGVELATRVVRLMAEYEPWELDDVSETKASSPSSTPWKLGEVQACSFRGLVPAGKTWSHDFAGKSHLMYGPNGCGKSSLLGAIAWCLTGKLFRDDRAPSESSEQPVFTTGDKPKAGKHPDALALLDANGASVEHDTPYWVELQFLAEDDAGSTQEVWIQRHSNDGLAESKDGKSWEAISDLGEAGIDELDAELHVLLPTKIPHLRFGDNPDLVWLFSQIIGLDHLAEIAAVADRAGTALRTVATKKEKDLKGHDSRISELVAEIEEAAIDDLKEWPTYRSAMQASRNLQAIEAFGNELRESIDQQNEQLGKDIGLEIPEEDTPEFTDFNKKLKGLSDRVQSAVDELRKPVSTLFPASVWKELPNEEEIETAAEKLDAFEEDARRQIKERLEWEIRKRKEPKVGLLLSAVQYFAEGSNHCPVCTQSLEAVPQIRDDLETLRPYITHEHLKKDIDDLRHALLSRLEEIVPKEKRNEGTTPLSERLLKDWQGLKESRFVGLLRTIADRYDSAVEQLSETPQAKPIADVSLLPGTVDARLQEKFSSLEQQLGLARKYVQLCRLMVQHSRHIKDSLESALTTREAAGPASLLLVLERGKKAAGHLQSLESVYKSTRGIWTKQKERDEVDALIKRYRAIANATAACKAIGKLVRAETVSIVGQVEPRMKEYYRLLYDDELLLLDRLTPGHAANSNIKNQLSLYLRAGNKLVPAEPFCNAGRLRALALSFAFALLDQSRATLALLILDDPAMSLDDDHMARFVNRLVRPCLAEKQVILATHYREFYKRAEGVFSRPERLQLVPRRTAGDEVSFEPMDLLQRVEMALTDGTCAWLEMGINLRKWAERTLRAISVYCPERFVRYNDIPGSTDAYARICDDRIASPERDLIVKALRSNEFKCVMHRLAHDEDPHRTEVEDALAVLKTCRKEVDREIEKFKGSYSHEQSGQALPSRAIPKKLALKSDPLDASLQIVAAAAAASGRGGIDSIETTEIRLDGCQIALIKQDVLDPIARRGQYVLLDAHDNLPNDEDLVIVETEEGKRYARRFWNSDKGPYLEGVNSTSCFPPVQIKSGSYKVRRIVGVLFDGPGARVSGGNDEEWCSADGNAAKIMSKLKGVWVKQTSMEPLARDGQIVLIHQEDAKAELRAGDLACVNAEDIDNVVKRCYPGKEKWILCPVNPTIVEDPICVEAGKIHQAYRLAGVLFEADS